MQTSSSRGMARMWARRARARAFFVQGNSGLSNLAAAASRHSMAVNLLAWGRLDQARELAARNPDTQVVIDHLGLLQPFAPPPPAQPFAELPQVVALAAQPNIAIKISGAGTLSHEPFPYADIWEPVGRILDAFGLDR